MFVHIVFPLLYRLPGKYCCFISATFEHRLALIKYFPCFSNERLINWCKNKDIWKVVFNLDFLSNG
jgi:hypothetical protein